MRDVRDVEGEGHRALQDDPNPIRLSRIPGHQKDLHRSALAQIRDVLIAHRCIRPCSTNLVCRMDLPQYAESTPCDSAVADPDSGTTLQCQGNRSTQDTRDPMPHTLHRLMGLGS